MCNSDWTIHVRSTVHVQAVEMQTCGLISQGVLDVDDDLVAFRDYYRRQRPLSVDANDWACLLAVGIRMDPSYVEIIRDGRAGSD